MNIFRILHLSDIHFRTDYKTQDIVLKSLKDQISEITNDRESPFNLILFTGDIAFSGKEEEYSGIKPFIDDLLLVAGCTSSEILFVPGNHDVDRSEIDKGHLDWWYNFDNEDKLNTILESETSFSTLMKKINNYSNFTDIYMNGAIIRERFGQFVHEISIDSKIANSINIVGINSSLFCGYDGDDEKKLAIGLEQISSVKDRINPKQDIVISILHHPEVCFHECDIPPQNILKQFSDIILTGHIHKVKNAFIRNESSGRTIHLTAGAAFKKRRHINSFNTIEINLDNGKCQAKAFKYLDEDHKWILNRDINTETDGAFEFTVVKEKSKVIPITNGYTLKAKIDIEFNSLNRDKVSKLLEGIKEITGDSNIKIIQMKKGSVEIYFYTKSNLAEFDQALLKKYNVLSLEKIDNTVDGPDSSVNHWLYEIKKEIDAKLNSPGAAFTHSRVDDISLDDIYVHPFLSEIKRKAKKEKILDSSSVLQKQEHEDLKIILYGQDNCGKSTLLRYWYKQYYLKGYIPVLISGNNIKEISQKGILKLVQREIVKQYKTVSFNPPLKVLDFNRIIVMIDDYHRIRFNESKFKSNLISNLTQTFPNIIISGNEIMKMDSFSLKIGQSIEILDSYRRFEFLEFGPKLRYELIKKWNCLGAEELDANDLIRLNNETEDHIDSIIGKNFVPSFPVYLLTILQARELSSPNRPEYSQHGFYYELLINEALNKAIKTKSDISLIYNFITEFCYFLFDSNIRLSNLHINDYLKFHLNYCDDYNINIGPEYIRNILVESKILKINDEYISISYKYVYYFFIARYLANNISSSKIKQVIKLMCERVHRDEFASIIMFLTHLSKDNYIINELINNSRTLFKDVEPSKMEDDVKFINDYVDKLPEFVYEPFDIEQLKEEELIENEELQRQEKEFDSETDVYEYNLNEDISSLDILSRFIRSIKTIEILGQVTKKYWGELKAQQKYELAEETYMLGLRTLGFYFESLTADPDLLVEYLTHIYKRKHINKNLSKADIDRASRNFLFELTVSASFGIIKRITNAIGYEKLESTFEQIVSNNDFTSVKLIDNSIKLDYNSKIPWQDMRDLKKQIDKHYLANSVLKRLVINYLYVFYTSYEDKQKICNYFDIRIDEQRMIDATSRIKK